MHFFTILGSRVSALGLSLLFCIPLFGQQTEGLASFYADRFHGKPTSTGEKHDKNGFMAASKEFDFGTVLEVTNVATGQSVEVTVNDCGPHHPDRIIDLSKAAAKKISILKNGVSMVRLRVVKESDLGPTCHRRAWAKAKREREANANEANPPKANKQEVAILGNAPMAPTVATIDSVPAAPTVAGPPPNVAVANPSKSKPKATTAAKGPAPRPATAPASAPTPAPKPVGVPVAAAVKAPVPATYDESASPAPTPAAPAPAKKQQEFAPDELLFGVQVAAFGKAENAKALTEKLSGMGFENVWSVKVGTVYRVFAGKFYFQNQADEYKTKIREAGYPDAAVRRVQ